MTSNIDAEKCAECPMPFGKHLPDCTIGAAWNTPAPTATQCSSCASLQMQLLQAQQHLGLKDQQINEAHRMIQSTQNMARQYHSEVEALTLKVLRLQKSGEYPCGCHDGGMCMEHLKMFLADIAKAIEPALPVVHERSGIEVWKPLTDAYDRIKHNV